MNIVTSIENGFSDFGNTLTIQSKNSVSKTTGFIQPISYQGSKYYNFNISDVSAKENIRYLCICKSDAEINRGDRLILDNTTYSIVRSEKLIYKDKCLYKWAILKLYYPAKEDDFVDD